MIATLVILAVAVVCFVSNRVPVVLVGLGVSVALWAAGVLDLDLALAGFSDPTVVFIAALFVVGESLDASGVTAWVGEQVINRAGTRRGPLLTLTGTPVNVIVSDAAQEAAGRPFGFFEFALVGGPLLLGTCAIILTFGRRLLPVRTPATLPADLHWSEQALREQYQLPPGQSLAGPARGMAEVIVAPRSELIGLDLFPGMTTPSGDLVVVAVQRAGEDLAGPRRQLRTGDVLLLSGTWDDLERHTAGPEVLAVTPPELLRRAVPLGREARRSLAVLAAMVLLLSTGLVPPVIAGLLAAGAIIATGVLTPTQAFRSISWSTVVLVAGMIPLSTAFVVTGTADALASGLLALTGSAAPTIALLVLCLVTMVLGQLISNTATVLIVAPVAVAVADDLQVSPLAFLMALTVSGAAAFLTPVATPANTMVLEPGGYRFGDYWKLGLPLHGWFLLVAVVWVPIVWPLR